MQSPDTSIRISIALLTRNAPDRLERCLQSVRAQEPQPFEIIVSDDSAPEFAAANQALAEGHGCRYLQGPRRGLYANRNAAALAARGTHIRTMDDDHLLPAGHLALCLAALLSDPEAIWTTGEIGFVEGRFYDKGETANQLHPSGYGIPPENPQDNWAIADGSTFYPASVFARGFRMAEQFGYGSSYLEFGAFLYRHGYRSRCIPGAVVEHYATMETVHRQNRYAREQAESGLFASLAFNLFFRPDFFQACKYTMAIIWSSHFNPVLIARIPIVAWGVYKRWRKL